jgi:hypothetical protein
VETRGDLLRSTEGRRTVTVATAAPAGGLHCDFCELKSSEGKTGVGGGDGSGLPIYQDRAQGRSHDQGVGAGQRRFRLTARDAGAAGGGRQRRQAGPGC